MVRRANPPDGGPYVHLGRGLALPAPFGGGVMHTITLHGCTEARCGDLVISSERGPIGKLARAMQAAGLDEAPVRIMRGETPVFATDMPLSWWAGRSTTETEKVGVRFSKWAPNPLFSGAV